MIFSKKANITLAEDRSSGSMKFVDAEKSESFRARKRASVTMMPRFSITGKKETSSNQDQLKAAIKEVMECIYAQRDNRDVLQRYIERKTESVATLIAEGNELGATYAMRKLLRAQAEKDFALQAIGRLNKLVHNMKLDQVSTSFYVDEVERILTAPITTAVDLNDSEFVLLEAKKLFNLASRR